MAEKVYIEREAAIQAVCFFCNNKEDFCTCADKESIMDIPAADVVEVRHGYWYIVEYEYLNCSECGESYYTGAESTREARERLANGEYYPYCPHCGAKMDGERQGE